MNPSLRSIQKSLFLGLSLLSMGLLYNVASAQSLESYSWQSANNKNTPLHLFDFKLVNNGSVASTSVNNLSYTGLDSKGHTQTMTFSGNAHSNAGYGNLHSYATASLTNPYYNSANANYIDDNGDIANPNGSPSNVTSLATSIFEETLQYGGVLQSGYRARFIYHIHGFNTGSIGNEFGVLDVLGVDVDGSQLDIIGINDPFPTPEFAFDWATKGISLNGTTPQTLRVQLDTQVNFVTSGLIEGQNYAGTSDLGATVTLTGIELIDINGNLASGWTVTSGSGTVYNAIQGRPTAVPEPGSIALLVCSGASGGMMFLRRRMKRA